LSLSLLLAACLVAAAARSQVARDTTLDLPTTEYFVAPGAAFRSNNDVNFGDYLDFDTVHGGASGQGCAYAPVDLPQGSTVSSLTAWIFDNDAGGSVSVDLKRRAATGSDPASVMASVLSSIDSPSVLAYPDFSVNYSVIDNENYTYFLVRCDFGILAGLRLLYMVKVGFTR